MLTFITPRLRVPVWIAITGTVFAAAWLVRGGPTWWFAVFIEASVLGRVFAVYKWGGEDTDEGALAGSRADERQKLVAVRSRALGGRLAGIAAFLGLTVAVAIRATWWWPFAIILAVTLLGYLFGLSAYGAGSDEGDQEGAPYLDRPRVSS